MPRAASYITKYITKDMFGSEGWSGSEHLYFASKGLKRDEVLAIGESVYGAQAFVDAGYDVRQNEFCSKVEVDHDLGMTLIKPFEDLGKKDRFNAPRLPLKLTKKQRAELLKRRGSRVAEYCEVRRNAPVFSSAKLTDAEIQRLDELFNRAVSQRSSIYEQLSIQDIERGG